MITKEYKIRSLEELTYSTLDYSKQQRNETKFKATCLKNRLKRKNKKK